MTPTEQIDQYIAQLTENSETEWKGELLAQLRKVIHEANPQIQEEWKWEVPIFTNSGMVCAISAFKDHVKINFFKGAHLQDPYRLINNGLDSKNHRSIDFKEGDKVNEGALKELVKEAVNLNIRK